MNGLYIQIPKTLWPTMILSTLSRCCRVFSSGKQSILMQPTFKLFRLGNKIFNSFQLRNQKPWNTANLAQAQTCRTSNNSKDERRSGIHISADIHSRDEGIKRV